MRTNDELYIEYIEKRNNSDFMAGTPVSIFHYDENMHIKETTIKGETDSNSSPGEKPVTAALYKYGFMNLYLIQKNINKNGHKNLNVSKVLLKMQRQGKVKKYTIIHDEGSEANLDVYILSPDYEQKMKMNTSIYKKDMQDISYILESMVLCQWHNSLLSEDGCTEVLYNCKKCCSSGFVMIPSIIRYTTGKQSIYVCGVPINRNNYLQNLRFFVANLTYIHQYLDENKNRYQNYLIILLGESVNQIEELAKLLLVIKETKDMDLVFTIDMATYLVNPLKNLYSIKRMQGGSEITLMKV